MGRWILIETIQTGKQIVYILKRKLAIVTSFLPTMVHHRYKLYFPRGENWLRPCVSTKGQKRNKSCEINFLPCDGQRFGDFFVLFDRLSGRIYKLYINCQVSSVSAADFNSTGFRNFLIFFLLPFSVILTDSKCPHKIKEYPFIISFWSLKWNIYIYYHFDLFH